MTKTRAALPLAAIFALTALPAHATVTFFNGYSGTPAEVNSSTQLAYSADVSASDLINGMTPSPTTGWNTGNEASPNELTDGIHGVGFGEVPGDRVQGGWTTVNATATYSLGTGANGLGYDITSIQSIADWVNVGFGNQDFTFAVQLVGGGGYVDVFRAENEALGAGGGTTKVTISALDVTGIEAIRVTANAQSGHGSEAFVWRELDVFGTDTIPEPASASLFGLGALALFRRRRG